MGRGEVHTSFGWGSLREGDHREDLGVDGKMIVKRSFKKEDGGGHGQDWAGSGYEQVAGFYICSNEASGSIKCGGVIKKRAFSRRTLLFTCTEFITAVKSCS
jgi:hypothetical protein